MKLSILIPTVPRRKDKVRRLLDDIEKQVMSNHAEEEVEIICLYDNKKVCIGKKRNYMVQMAQGDFIVFIDDDDRVSSDYIADILRAIKNNRSIDCISYNVEYCDARYPDIKFLCRYGLQSPVTRDDTNHTITAPPGHIHVFSKRVHSQCRFMEIQTGEDSRWTIDMLNVARTEVNIDKVLYYYDFDFDSTETQGGAK